MRLSCQYSLLGWGGTAVVRNLELSVPFMVNYRGNKMSSAGTRDLGWNTHKPSNNLRSN